MPIKVAIISEGKSQKEPLEKFLLRYKTRMKSTILVEEHFSKTPDSFLEKPGRKIALHAAANQLTSEEFSSYIFEKNTQKIYFFIGSATGFTHSFLQKIPEKISLSKLTFPHQIVRLLLLEQLYRASEIQKGSKYHK